MSDTMSQMKREFEADYKLEPIGSVFVKYDHGKPRYSLVPPLAENEMVKVLTFGAHKYDVDNWRKVDDISRYIDAGLRHIAEYRKGVKLDPETGLHHLAHAMCCLSFITELDLEIK